MKSYDYAHRQGVEEISWERFAELSALLSEKLAQAGVEVILGIARAGLFPAAAAAAALRCELFPVRVTRRLKNRVIYTHPVWKVDVPDEIAGKVTAVVDEIADSGETLALVADRARQRGARQVLSAALVTHSWAKPFPEAYALQTDALVIFPWDRQVLIDGRWQPHPEIVEALRLQDRGTQGAQP